MFIDFLQESCLFLAHVGANQKFIGYTDTSNLIYQLNNFISVIAKNKRMDSFFAKKGIGLSKNNLASIKPQRQHQLKSSESIPWTFHPSTPAIRPSTEPPWAPPQAHSHVSFISQPQQITQKSENFMNLPPKYNRQPMTMMPIQRREPPLNLVHRPSQYSNDNKRSSSRQKLHEDCKDVQAPTMSTQVFTSGFYATKINEVDQSLQKNDIKSMFDVSANRRESTEYKPSSLTYIELERKNETYLDKNSGIQDHGGSQKGILMMRQKEEGKRSEDSRERSVQRRRQVLETRDTRATSSYWIEEKIKLRQEIEQKDKMILQLQKKLTDQQRQYKTKIMMLEYDIKGLKGASNRLEIEYSNARKLLEVERKNNQQAQEQMDKLMFFDDDLIHAKDYNRLKREMEEVLTENAKLFQDHQKYILQVTEMRRNFTNKIEELEEELVKLRNEFFRCKEKVENVGVYCEDKRMLIKLQHQINFLMKKSQENMSSLLQKEQNLEKAHLQIKQLIEKGNRKDESRQHFFEGLNLQQLLESISRYQVRIADISDMLESKKQQNQKQKKTIETLSTELRQARQDKKINTLKERSNQNILKNQVAALQQSLQSEIHLRCKKVAALEEKIARKVKELSDKDNFIKEFLLNRAKDIDKSTVQDLLLKINSFFCAQEPMEEATQSEVQLQSQGTVDM